MTFTPWSPKANGHQRVWRFYCRVAIERLPLMSWRKEAAQRVLGGSCKVDQLERASESLDNTSVLYA
jgi:hypothetical protein